jgi:predicted dehydrogenase
MLARLRDDVEVAAVVDTNVELATECAAPLGAAVFADVGVMLEEIGPDLVVVATPHPSHAALAIACLDAGAHVLVEKPMAIDVAEADAMLLAARRARRELIVDLQYRFIPSVEVARRLIDEGRIGRLLRATCTESTSRSRAYYASAPWRGTWAGEGGGVLVNQAPHPLDLLCYLGGTPVRVVAWTPTLAHSIECEDTVVGQVEFADGGVAQIAFSTVEPSPLRIELIGERAKLELTPHSLALTTWQPDLARHIATDTTMYEPPHALPHEIPLEPYSGEEAAHLELHRDVVEALRTGRQPRTAAATALAGLEVANAIALSAQGGGLTVELPLDRSRFATLLSEKRATAR